MQYQEIQPKGFLCHFVQSFWEYDSGDAMTSHTILPDGHFDLIAEFENGILTTVKLTGVWTQPKNVSIPGNTTIFAVRFKLLAAEYLFQQELQSLLDSVAHLPLGFWGIDQFTKNDFATFVTVLTHNMETAIGQLKTIDNRKLTLFELIYQKEAVRIGTLSEAVFWSSRQMNRYFNAQFGFPLKTFLKIVRCHASYASISEGELSPQSDFFDQSHFIKELKKYTGATPKELHQNKNDRFLQLSKTEQL